MIGYLLRRLWTACQYSGTWNVCLAPRCGRLALPTPSKWCRLHTDVIIRAHNWPEVTKRLACFNEREIDLLDQEIKVGLAVADLKWRRLLAR